MRLIFCFLWYLRLPHSDLWKEGGGTSNKSFISSQSNSVCCALKIFSKAICKPPWPSNNCFWILAIVPVVTCKICFIEL